MELTDEDRAAITLAALAGDESLYLAGLRAGMERAAKALDNIAIDMRQRGDYLDADDAEGWASFIREAATR